MCRPRRAARARAATRALAVAMASLSTTLMFVVSLAAGVFASSCAAPGANAKYPPRRPGCQLSVYHASAPSVAAWDDIGPAEVGCHIDTSHSECLRRFYAEACRMGGDIVYNVPKRPLRPRDQVIMFSGQVAHTRARKAAEARKDEDGELPPPASEEESKGPIQPLAPSTRTAPVPAPLAVPAPSPLPEAAPAERASPPATSDGGAPPTGAPPN